MSTFVLLEVADDGTVNATKLTDPVTVTESVSVPLSSLFPQTAPSSTEPSSTEAPPTEPSSSPSDAQPPTAP